MAVYGLTAEEYWQIYNYQGQRCFICQRAIGARKRLSVDHDHETRIVRGLLCTPCNRNVLGHLRDDKYALQRAIEYLAMHPARMAGVNVVVPENLTTNGG